jgi:hypothetical protein
MAITSTAQAASAKNFKMEVFDESGTWTAPDGVEVVEVIAVGAGGGGGGGGGGYGGPKHTFASGNAGALWSIDLLGAGGGGGGGGGGAVVRTLVPVTPGTTYPINIGAGGTGGKRDDIGKTYNHIANAKFQDNLTGWTASSGTISRFLATTTADWTFKSTIRLYYTYPIGVLRATLTTNTTLNLTYDSGTGQTFDPFLTFSQFRFNYNSLITNTGLSTISGSLVFFQDTTTLDSRTFAMSPLLPVSSTQNSVSNVRTGFFNILPPASANRFLINMTAVGRNTQGTLNVASNMQFSQFSLIPTLFNAFPDTSATFTEGYIDPDAVGFQSINGFQMLAYEGAAGNSRTKFNHFWGSPSQYAIPNDFVAQQSMRIAGSAFPGLAGNNGGNTEFGTSITALGGGGGGGGRHTFMGGIIPFQPVPSFQAQNLTNPKRGGNGGGYGNLTTVASFSGDTIIMGRVTFLAAGGGGGVKGWSATGDEFSETGYVNALGSATSQGSRFRYFFPLSAPSRAGSAKSLNEGLQGFGGGLGIGQVALSPQTEEDLVMGLLPRSLQTFLSPIIGGQGEGLFGWGGNGGNSGPPAATGYSTEVIANVANNLTSRLNLDASDRIDIREYSYRPNAKGGFTSFATIVGPNMDGVTNPNGSQGVLGVDGENGFGYGGGGGGASGGGTGTLDTFLGTPQRGGFGGNGGDGSDGYLVIMYWE